MLEVESYMKSIKESICKRLDRYENKFYRIEISQSECKRN